MKKAKAPLAADYRNFRLSKLNTEEFRHLKLLLFWPAFILSYVLLERLVKPDSYTPVHCFLDDLIPFHEGFLIFYALWYVWQVWISLYTIAYDIPTYKKFMKYIMFTYLMADLIYLIYPTCQNLRPAAFPRDNFFTDLVAMLYQIDTNTNVCPSTHVLGAVGVALATCRTERFSGKGWKVLTWCAALLICASTVFLKQHSVVDSITAIPVCLLGYIVAFRPDREAYSVQKTE